jgi:antitoxin component YwqK of YwqJK toxin-antitoxin module
MYFDNTILLENTLLPYFDEAEPLKYINKKFYRLDYEKYLTHIQLHGILETYYLKTKTIMEREIYKNGKLNGIYKSWYETHSDTIVGDNSQLYERCNYKNGKLDGLYENWFQNGQLLEQGYYKNGKLDGSCEVWHNNGRLYIRKNYKDNELHGLYEQWYQDGKLAENDNFKYGYKSDICYMLILAFIGVIISVLAVVSGIYSKYF